MDLEPGGLHFGDRLVGTPSSSGTVTLSNTLTGPVTISSIAVTGPSANDFTQTNDCPLAPATLVAGGSCTINVTFLHENLGEKTAAITVSDDAPGNPQQAVNLTGAVVNPTATLSRPEIDFGNQPLLITSVPQDVMLTNAGVGRLTITDIHAVGENFGVTHDCGTTVDEGGECTITVTYTPQAAGNDSAVVTIYDNASDSPQIINLSGVGVAADVQLSTAALDFGEQALNTASTPQIVVVENTGSVALLITGFAVSPGDFEYASPCPVAPATLAAGEACEVEITFFPQNTGAKSSTFTIFDNATGSPHTVTLTGTGMVTATLTASPVSLDFGNQDVGTTSPVKTAIVSNAGPASVFISSLGVAGDFVENSDCSGDLEPLASCVVTVSFRPTAPGERTGTVTINDNAPGTPHLVSLTGNGIGPGVGLSAASLEFGNQLVGPTSPPQSVTLTNNGTATLNIVSIAITGNDAAEFELTHTCGASLAVAAECVITVTFKSTSTGTKAAQVSVASDAAGSPHAIGLSGSSGDFALDVPSGGSTSATVEAGQTATYNLQLAPTGFVGEVALGCAFEGSTPTGASCAVSPSSFTLNGVGPVTFAVNIATTARALAAPQAGDHGSPLLPKLWARHALPLLLGLLLALSVAALYERRGSFAGHRPALQWAVPLSATLLAVLFWAACGGESSALAPQVGTPAGTYTLTVTGTASGVSRTSNLTLTVN